MRILVYSDVHGNLPAFEAMLKQAGPCDQYISLGDLVNYGPWSNECVDLATSLPNAVLLKGNHEEAFAQGIYPGSNQLVKQFFDQCFPGFKRLDVIKTFIPTFLVLDFVCTHTIFDKYIYPDTSVVLDNNYIIGHSHHQFCYQNNGFTLYNAGSVGQNRKYINAANFLICDTSTKNVEMKQVVFDIKVMLDKMQEVGYPDDCINYYSQKQVIQE